MTDILKDYKGLKVYIAGSYEQGDKEENVENALMVATAVLKIGHYPFVPHLCHYWHQEYPQPYEKWMDYDMKWLEACDVFLRLPGDSPGADREEARARELGMPIVPIKFIEEET